MVMTVARLSGSVLISHEYTHLGTDPETPVKATHGYNAAELWRQADPRDPLPASPPSAVTPGSRQEPMSKNKVENCRYPKLTFDLYSYMHREVTSPPPERRLLFTGHIALDIVYCYVNISELPGVII